MAKRRKKKLPPCEPKPRRVRVQDEAFCERSKRYCAAEHYGTIGGVQATNTMVLIVLGMFAALAMVSDRKDDGPLLPSSPRSLPPRTQVPAQQALQFDE